MSTEARKTKRARGSAERTGASPAWVGENRTPDDDHRSIVDATVVIPVNAQGDLGNVKAILGDLSRYSGPHRIETILVVNNFPEAEPPDVGDLERLATRVFTIPNVRRPGEDVCFSARIPGARAASSEALIFFDADCRVPNPTAVLDWYVERFREGAAAAYTFVGHYDYQNAVSVHLCFAVHHAARWVKRRLLGIPTTRGSNYAMRRDVLLDLYERGFLADAINVGPTVKRSAGPVVYGSSRALRVLTSGRMFEPGWRWILPYFMYRLRYNLRVLPARDDVASVTGRENDPVRRYENNRRVRT